MVYRLHDIFSSLQGEGRNAGRPATFIRFSTCNLSCPWCDTRKDVRYRFSIPEILLNLRKRRNRSVVVTGGEPTIQIGLSELVAAIRKEGYWVALETNGLVAPENPELFDYVAVSPKSEVEGRYEPNHMLRKADEVRIVATSSNIARFCLKMRELIEAKNYYISPLEKDRRIHYRRAMDLLVRVNAKSPGVMPPWCLSIQQHKVLGLK